MEKVRLDKKGRLTIPAEYRERTANEIRVASRRLAEGIARKR